MVLDKVKPIIDADWLSRLAPFIESPEFDKIVNHITDRKAQGVRVYPSTQDMFKCLNKCSLKDLKVIMAAQDPYHQPKTADGLAFSCSYTGVEQPSLKHINNEIQRTVSKAMPRQTDLSYLAEQGVLLINRSLSVEQGAPNSHKGLWDGFHNFLFNQVIRKKEGPLVFILLGKDSQEYFTRLARQGDYILTAYHPAFAERSGRAWDCEDVFNRCNTYLLASGKEQINW